MTGSRRVRRSPSASGESRKTRLVSFALLAALAGVPLAGEAGAGGESKTARPTARYVLTLEFDGWVSYKSKTGSGDNRLTTEGQQQTGFLGTSRPFLLVNYGSRAEPNIRISGSTPSLVVTGFLDHAGTGTVTVSNPAITCSEQIKESAGQAGARARVTISSNRLLIRMIPEGAASAAYGPNSCTGETTVETCTECLALPEVRGFGPDWWGGMPGRINPKDVKFGRAFTIRKLRDYASEPEGRATAPIVGWQFQWILRFKPVKR